VEADYTKTTSIEQDNLKQLYSTYIEYFRKNNTWLRVDYRMDMSILDIKTWRGLANVS
jgi:hypothetical protein